MHLFRASVLLRAPSIMHHAGGIFAPFLWCDEQVSSREVSLSAPRDMQPMCTRNIKSGDFGSALANSTDKYYLCAKRSHPFQLALGITDLFLSLSLARRAIYIYLFICISCTAHTAHRLLVGECTRQPQQRGSFVMRECVLFAFHSIILEFQHSKRRAHRACIVRADAAFN